MPTHSDGQAAEERAVFTRFAGVCGLPIDVGSIESRKDPEPDILCCLATGESIAFELVESVGQKAHETAHRELLLAQWIRDECEGLTPERRDGLAVQFAGTWIRIRPGTGGFPETAVRRELRAVFDHLRLNPGIDRDFLLFELRALSPLIGLSRHPSEMGGPVFNEIVSTIDGAHFAERVEGKFTKVYETDVPVDLLVHGWGSITSMPTEQQLVSVLMNRPEAPFRRVWFVDTLANSVDLVIPALP